MARWAWLSSKLNAPPLFAVEASREPPTPGTGRPPLAGTTRPELAFSSQLLIGEQCRPRR